MNPQHQPQQQPRPAYHVTSAMNPRPPLQNGPLPPLLQQGEQVFLPQTMHESNSMACITRQVLLRNVRPSRKPTRDLLAHSSLKAQHRFRPPSDSRLNRLRTAFPLSINAHSPRAVLQGRQISRSLNLNRAGGNTRNHSRSGPILELSVSQARYGGRVESPPRRV
jgi:hypothetical protein